MIDYNSFFAIVPVLCGLAFLVAAAFLKIFPPKNVNLLYGYRTRSSMKSEDRWHFAQAKSANHMLVSGGILVVIGFIQPYLQLSEMMNIYVGLGIVIVSVGIMIYSTEKAIKEKFRENE